MNAAYNIVDTGHITPCWIWNGTISKDGYGPYKFFYEIAKGKVPFGLVLNHICRLRSCVNPEHIEAITVKQHVIFHRDTKEIPQYRVFPKGWIDEKTKQKEQSYGSSHRSVKKRSDRRH